MQPPPPTPVFFKVAVPKVFLIRSSMTKF
uniref:(California timema) hypothetical protein n=1 Tax=Timema californicum TaxID=61474 RepID=A0A7R9JIU6_TIMCA|nr:unnamed protein product [Timema californicum]